MSVAEFFASMAYGPAPEGAGPALRWIEAHDGRFGVFINNEMVPTKAGERSPLRLAKSPTFRVIEAIDDSSSPERNDPIARWSVCRASLLLST